jgi:hypothetical protein
LGQGGGYGDFRSEVAAVFSSKFCNIPVRSLVIHHECIPSIYWTFILKLINNFLSQTATSIITVSEATKKSLMYKSNLFNRYSSMKCLTIYPGYPIKNNFENNVLDNFKLSYQSEDIKIGMMDISSVFNEGLTYAANNKELAFYVSISNQFISNKEKIIEDAKSNLLKNNINKSFFNAASDAWNALFEYAAKRTNQELIVNMLRQADSEGWGKYCLPAKIPSEEELDNSQFWKTINDDPSNALQALAIPTLVIYGEHDKYLNVKLNAERIDQNFKSKPKLLSIRIYGNTDHYLKSSNHPEHLWPTYDEDFIQQTMQWISSMSN